MNRFIQVGAVMAFVSIVLGAFGAHALKSRLSPESLISFETGVKYLMYHALGIILVCVLNQNNTKRNLTPVIYLFMLGAILFSGSIFLLSTREISGVEAFKFLGPVTPLGGLCMIIGWGLLFFKYLKN
jgi:uncharacterized membrane protein YgdD (TMEM256/DUF423 family)